MFLRAASYIQQTNTHRKTNSEV